MIVEKATYLPKQLLAEKDQNLASKTDTIKSQAIIISLLQAEIERLRKV